MAAEIKQYIYANGPDKFYRAISIIFDSNNDPTDKDFEMILDFVEAGTQLIRTQEDSIQPQKRMWDTNRYQWIFHSTNVKRSFYTARIRVTLKIEGNTLADEELIPLNLNNQPGSSPVQRTAAVVRFDYRPGFKNDNDEYLHYASAPGVLDFRKSDVVLSQSNENEFRQAIVETGLCFYDLGANRVKGAHRADAYCDAVSWDSAMRYSVRTSQADAMSSCGLVIRNIWWLCGARGTDLMDNAYSSGSRNVLGSNGLRAILDSDKLDECRQNLPGTAPNKFWPKIGDAIHVERGRVENDHGSRHIFTICAIMDGKTISLTDDGSRTIVRNSDGTTATSISFETIEGGQDDGGHWKCHGIQKKDTRTLQLNNGFFETKVFDGPLKGTNKERPIIYWIDIWAARDKFTANRIIPVRVAER